MQETKTPIDDTERVRALAAALMCCAARSRPRATFGEFEPHSGHPVDPAEVRAIRIGKRRAITTLRPNEHRSSERQSEQNHSTRAHGARLYRHAHIPCPKSSSTCRIAPRACAPSAA